MLLGRKRKAEIACVCVRRRRGDLVRSDGLRRRLGAAAKSKRNGRLGRAGFARNHQSYPGYSETSATPRLRLLQRRPATVSRPP